MEFNVNGITFNLDELQEVALSELKSGTISRSHLFHVLPGNKRAVLLLRAGDYLDASFISKYLDKGLTHIKELEVVTQSEIDSYKVFWNSIKVARKQKNQFLNRDELIEKLTKDFWEQNDSSYLSFAIACFEEFYHLPQHMVDKLSEKSMLLYTRALLLSSISTVSLLISDITDYKFIKDFYNVAFVLDYGFIEYDDYHYIMSMACEAERNVPGTGLDYLTSMKRNESEIHTFRHHPKVSFDAIKGHEDLFTHTEVLDLVKYHHEKRDGSGFPYGINYSGLSETETILSFCDHYMPFDEHIFLKGDGQKILKESFTLLKQREMKLLPIQKVVSKWESAFSWADGKIGEAS